MDDIRAIFVQYMTNIVDTYLQMVGQYAMTYIEQEFSPGGSQYELIMKGAIKTAKDWYAGYSPEVYERGYTLSDPNNITIDVSNLQLVGTDITGSIAVANISPHVNFAEEGFYFYKRGKQYHRRGTDMMAGVPSELHLDIEIPSEMADMLFDMAASVVFG